jgi:hypothetical protein
METLRVGRCQKQRDWLATHSLRPTSNPCLRIVPFNEGVR